MESEDYESCRMEDIPDMGCLQNFKQTTFTVDVDENELVNPSIAVVDGCYYRVLSLPDIPIAVNAAQKSYVEIGGEEEEEEEMVCKGKEMVRKKEEEEEEKNIWKEMVKCTLTDKKLYRIEFYCAKAYYGYIIGRKGATLRAIEQTTGSNIVIPKFGNKQYIVITNHSKDAAFATYKNLQAMVEQAREVQPFSHFLSFPIVSDEIIKQFNIFKENVLKCPEVNNVTKELFQQANKLHVTLGMLVINDNQEREHVHYVLKKCQTEVILPLVQNQKLIVRLRGIQYMNDDPSEVTVLYGKVESTDKDNLLQKLINKIMEFCYNAGIVKKQHDEIKLHVTLMNVTYAARMDSYQQKTDTFNATKILQEYKDFVFGEVEIKQLHLSQRYTTAKDGYFRASCAVDLH